MEGGEQTTLRKFQLGDRVWVKAPEKTVERRIATIMGVQNNGKDTLYKVEWEIDLTESGDRRPLYSAQEIAKAGR